MQDLNPPPIVQPENNGLEYLKALCNLFDQDFSQIPIESQNEGLQLFGGLYCLPAARSFEEQQTAAEELDDLCNEYFPIPEMEGVWDAIKTGIQEGLAYGWGADHKWVRGAYFHTRADMLFKRNKWQQLTMGDPDDLVAGYRYRRMMTSVFEAVVTVAGVSVATGDVAAPLMSSLSKGSEALISEKSVGKALQSGLQRLKSGGSGPIQALTRGRGVSALASRGGAAGIAGVYILGNIYANVKDEEEEIRAAIALRVLNDELDVSYEDKVNKGIGVFIDVSREWYQ